MSENLPIEPEVIAGLLKNSAIIKIVTILDLRSLSILDLLEYGVTTTDVNYALANRIIQLEKKGPLPNKESGPINTAKVWGDYYYYEFLNRKVTLTEIGLYILDSLRCGETEQGSLNRPREPYTEIYPHSLQV